MIRFIYSRGLDDVADESYMLVVVEDDLLLYAMDVTEAGVYDGTVIEVNAEDHSAMLNTERIKQMAGIKTEANSFAVLLCVDGCGIIKAGADGKEMLPFFKGDCIFIPADSDELLLHGNSTLLKISC